MSSDVNLQALDVAQTSMQVSANNIANMSTPEFESSRVEQESGENGQGVKIADISSSSETGPAIVNHIGEMQEGSNTDILTETVNMIEEENNFAANAKAIKTDQEMQDTILDIMA